MGTKIHSIEVYLPETVLSNTDIEKEFPEWTADKIEEKIGIRNRHVVTENETALDLAVKAGEKVLQNYSGQIDMLILCTQSPDYYLPSSACILQEKLKLPNTVGAFDFNLGCSGFVYGLSMAKGFINSGISNSVLLITSETYTKHINKLDKGNRTIFGDGATATILEKSDSEHIFEFIFGTDGNGANNLIIPNGGLRNKAKPNAELIDDGSGNLRTDNNLFMNGPEIFNFTIQSVPKAVQKALEKNNQTIESIDYVIFHQANKYMLDYLRKKVKVPEDKFYMNMLNTGNTVSSTIPIALKDSIESGKLVKGNKVLLVGFGVGYSWGATVIEI
jgi:3-oxoacyl-[acyl-carrier-protein] synthase III